MRPLVYKKVRPPKKKRVLSLRQYNRLKNRREKRYKFNSYAFFGGVSLDRIRKMIRQVYNFPDPARFFNPVIALPRIYIPEDAWKAQIAASESVHDQKAIIAPSYTDIKEQLLPHIYDTSFPCLDYFNTLVEYDVGNREFKLKQPTPSENK